MEAIVYTSRTGFTKKYACLLGEKVDLPVYSIEEAENELNPGSDIFYLGWLLDGEPEGLPEVVELYTISGIALVGMGFRGNGRLWEEASANGGFAENVGTVFYLRGGFCPEQMTGVNFFLLKLMRQEAEKQALIKPNLENEEMLKILQNGGNFVNPETLKPIVEWIKERTVLE